MRIKNIHKTARVIATPGAVTITTQDADGLNVVSMTPALAREIMPTLEKFAKIAEDHLIDDESQAMVYDFPKAGRILQ